MKGLGTDPHDVETRCVRWLGPAHSRSFNARRLSPERVDSVVERLRPLGLVWEVTYTTPSLAGLKLFYIDRVPYNNVGPDGGSCIIRQHPTEMDR